MTVKDYIDGGFITIDFDCVENLKLKWFKSVVSRAGKITLNAHKLMLSYRQCCQLIF